MPFVFSQPAAYSPDVLERIKKVESSLAGNIRIEGSPLWTVKERMDFHGVPGLTVGVISGGLAQNNQDDQELLQKGMMIISATDDSSHCVQRLISQVVFFNDVIKGTLMT